MALLDEIRRYVPFNEQEEKDRVQLLAWLESGTPLYHREPAAHLTASAWVVTPDRQRVLMAYHRLYDSWAWTGGHADGETDLCAVARREAEEETGVSGLRLLQDGIFSLEILSVDGHEKRGEYVSTHLHLNVTYLFEADPNAPLRCKPDENTDAAWIPVALLPEKVSEPWFLRRIYGKLLKKAEILGL